MEVARRREAVAGVVAHPAHDHSRLLDMPRHLPAGGFHQPLGRDAEAFGAQLVEPLDLGRAKSR